MVRNPGAQLGLVLLCAVTSAAGAQTSAPASAVGAVPAVQVKKSVHRKAVQAAAPNLDDTDRAARLARERRNFFAHDKTDDSNSDEPPLGSSSGAYLGGSSGLTPGMQFKF